MKTDFAAVKYDSPPTKKQLALRIAKGEILRNSDAVLAHDMGLGELTRIMPAMTLVLRPNGTRCINAHRLKNHE